MDLTNIAYATLAMSLFVSTIKVGGWILNAHPRAIINAGHWLIAALPVLALTVLLWLVLSSRWTAAMLLTAFLLPILAQAAPRWRLQLNSLKRGFRTITPDLSAGLGAGGFSAPPDSKLVEQSIAVLRAYLERSNQQVSQEARPQIELRPLDRHFASATAEPSGNARERMSTCEAFAVLGLTPTPSPKEIMAAHRRLEQIVDPQFGGTHYLLAKVNEARDVLLGDS
jgi:hypothetical protein